jgi:general secretion pathway protein G
MLELIFVVVIIGILSAIAIPKFAMTKDKAVVTKAKTTVASIRNAIATERQQRILRGKFTPITKLSVQSGVGANKLVFDGFDANVSKPVLEYPLEACETATKVACWYQNAATEYTYKMPLAGSVVFVLSNNRFNCKTSSDADDIANCRLLTR